ncbi:hypothetical protein E1301_Tti009326 [Triplophysa tibetana]|uniref:Uncharacterized protein n=1 Tax=Triplophysa tibetana TaxID=1572043 RepID=A0A5A9NT14_9TELE|nr:hypothetical protein E1301_Tti009326 [Triplophysa tibetana]
MATESCLTVRVCDGVSRLRLLSDRCVCAGGTCVTARGGRLTHCELPEEEPSQGQQAAFFLVLRICKQCSVSVDLRSVDCCKGAGRLNALGVRLAL